MGNVRVGLTPESHGRLDAVYRAHFPALMRVAYLLTGSNARAEDAVHEVFLRCADRLDHVERPGAYLRTAVVNECSRQFRRRQRDELSATVEEADDLPVELIELRAALQRLDMRSGLQSCCVTSSISVRRRSPRRSAAGAQPCAASSTVASLNYARSSDVDRRFRAPAVESAAPAGPQRMERTISRARRRRRGCRRAAWRRRRVALVAAGLVIVVGAPALFIAVQGDDEQPATSPASATNESQATSPATSTNESQATSAGTSMSESTLLPPIEGCPADRPGEWRLGGMMITYVDFVQHDGRSYQICTG